MNQKLAGGAMRSSQKVVAMLVAVVVAAAGCAERETADTDTMADHDGMTGMAHDGMGMGMHGDTAAMRRHADEAEAAAREMRAHLDEMRALEPAARHERIGDHTQRVAGLLSLMDRHMREMGMSPDMDHGQMGEMMGMSGEDHERMGAEMRAVRAEAEALQRASRDEVRQQLPAHLDRVEGLVGMMERAAASMRTRR
jgi:hypothetical protein